MCYFCVENLSNICKLIVCGSQTLRSTQQTQVSENIGLPNPVFTAEYSADNSEATKSHPKGGDDIKFSIG